MQSSGAQMLSDAAEMLQALPKIDRLYSQVGRFCWQFLIPIASLAAAYSDLVWHAQLYRVPFKTIHAVHFSSAE